MAKQLNTGDTAPDFRLKDQNGDWVDSKALNGKKYVLFFYPKDNTPTCTKEVCNLRDFYREIKAAGLEVFGISPDSVQSHARFSEKHQLPYILLSDEDHTVAEVYGVWGEKQMYGRKYMGILRTTFVINEKGVIEQAFHKVIAAEHANQILQA